MNTVKIRNIETNFPSCWSELNKRNLLFLAERFPFTPTHGFVYDFFIHCLNLPYRPKLAYYFARNIIISRNLDRNWKDDIAIELNEPHYFEQQILLAISALENFKWLFEMQPINDCIIDKIRVGFSFLYGPSKLLANVTADEFANADEFLLLFLKDKDVMHLHYLIAVLWREKSKMPTTSDVRIHFTEFDVEKRVKKIEKLPNRIKFACLLNYLGLRNSFLNRETSKNVFSSSGYSTKDDSNWGTILMRLAESNVFGTLKDTKNAYIHDIVDHLADLKKRSIDKK